MPNWCVNKLYVKGRRQDVEAFFQFTYHRTPEGALATRLEGRECEATLDYNDFIPYPEMFKQQDARAEAAHKRGDYTVKDGYNSGGYDWCVTHWGTKWNAGEVVQESKNCLRWESPWAPPKPVIDAMSLRFPTVTLTLRYFESGMGFQGTYRVKNGTVLQDTSRPYRGGLGG